MRIDTVANAMTNNSITKVHVFTLFIHSASVC